MPTLHFKLKSLLLVSVLPALSLACNHPSTNGNGNGAGGYDTSEVIPPAVPTAPATAPASSRNGHAAPDSTATGYVARQSGHRRLWPREDRGVVGAGVSAARRPGPWSRPC